MIPEFATYVVKIKPLERRIDVSRKVIEGLKRQEWVIAIEPMKNSLSFYVETSDAIKIEQMLSEIKEAFNRKKFGEVLFSKIQNVSIKSRKELKNAARAQG